MRFVSAVAALAAVGTAAAAAVQSTITTTQTKTVVSTLTVTSTVVKTSTSVVTSTKTSTVKSTATSTVTNTQFSTVTQPAQTVTQTQPAQTVTQTQPAQTITQTMTTTMPANTVYMTTTLTMTSTETDVVTQPAQTVYQTTTETDTVTQPAQTVYQTSTVTQPAQTVYQTQTVTQPASTVTLPASTVTVSPSAASSSSSSAASSASSSSSTSSSSTSPSFSSSSSSASSSAAAASSSSSSSSSVSSSVITTSATSIAYPISTQYTATSAAAVYAAQATAQSSSPTSNVQGLSFDRFVVIWLENTDYALSSTDPNLQWLASQGITLTTYFGLTHPSQPNYVASHGGDTFGMDNDNLNFVSANVSTIFDLLDTKGISWGEYQESMPYAGFEGKTWINQTSGQNNYVRKHNPGVIYNANSESAQRLSQMKNLTAFYTDLANQQLPQWMFITPNELNDGHDTGVTYAGSFMKNFLTPLLNNSYFMDNTLILVTFDETETYSISNNVFTFLLGGAIPQSLVGTTDSNYYNHYSQLSTVEANWGLPTLGRWDVGANVYSVVAQSTGDVVRSWTPTGNIAALNNMYFNSSYAGPFNSVKNNLGYPAPNVNAVGPSGRTVLPSIVQQWAGVANSTYYTTNLMVPDGMHAPSGWCTSGLC